MTLDLSPWGLKEGDSVRELVVALLEDHSCCVTKGEGEQLIELVIEEHESKKGK